MKHLDRIEQRRLMIQYENTTVEQASILNTRASLTSLTISNYNTIMIQYNTATLLRDITNLIPIVNGTIITATNNGRNRI